MAAKMKLAADLVKAPVLFVNSTSLFALSILNSGIKMNPPVLKLADRVVAKMLPPSDAELNGLSWFLSLNNSPRSVRPNHG